MAKINKLTKNNYVLSFNPETQEYEYKKVLNVFNNGIKKIVSVELEDGQVHRMTSNHKVFTSEGFMEVQDAKDILADTGFVKILNKTELPEEAVYDIEVQDNHTFCVRDKNRFAVVHNCGSQVPFSSINYGTNTTPEGQMLIENTLNATEEGLGNGETSIFPVQIFKIKEGVNANPGDPNYYLLEKAVKVTSKRMYPNFVNIDVPGNIEYYQEGKPETEMATMGCRTKTLAMPDGTGRVTNRGNIAFTTINLPRLGILAEHKIDKFFELLDQRITDCIDELLERVNYIKTKKVYNFPFLMGQNIYLGSENLGWNDSIEPALRNGTLAVGFIGIAEALKALIGKHHGESKEAYQLALKIVKRIRERTDKATSETGWMFGCFATPAEGLAERFAKIDQKKFGIIEGVTDRKFYTNSFHIPVYFPITATKKMQKEGPFHSLCNAGAITYVEMDGDPSKNLKAVMKLVQFSRKCGISYFSINHSVDRCPVCGYEGIIETDVCPHCGWKEGEEISLEELEKKGIDTKKLR